MAGYQWRQQKIKYGFVKLPGFPTSFCWMTENKQTSERVNTQTNVCNEAIWELLFSFLQYLKNNLRVHGFIDFICIIQSDILLLGKRKLLHISKVGQDLLFLL